MPLAQIWSQRKRKGSGRAGSARQSSEAQPGAHTPPHPTCWVLVAEGCQTWERGEAAGSLRGVPAEPDPCPGLGDGHTPSLTQRALSSCLPSPPTGLGWADKELMNEERKQSQRGDRGQLLTLL